MSSGIWQVYEYIWATLGRSPRLTRLRVTLLGKFLMFRLDRFAQSYKILMAFLRHGLYN